MEVRADTYLWAIRMFKSRSLASDAIKGGKVKLNQENFKPAHKVKIGEVYSITIGDEKKVIEVVALIDKRKSFEIAKKHYIDKSPLTEKKSKLPSAFRLSIKREKGSGRPTKKDRRDMDELDYF